MAQVNGMFAVHPITNCPHLTSCVAPVLNFEVSSACRDCGNVGENWVCLSCSKVFCSRYVQGHMQAHYAAAGPRHAICLSFSDLSVWCNLCDSYIKHAVLSPILDAAHHMKFGEARPGAAGRGPASDTGPASGPGAAAGSGTGSSGVGSRLGVPEDTTEFQDDDATVEAAVARLADMVRASKHTVVYTGAGVSTSARIPDYRGPNGVWTLRDQGKSAKMEIKLTQALPTTCHMARVQLMAAGRVHHVVSTNVDGLHRRSGLSTDQLSELHGNIYREICETCSEEYLRRFDTTATVAKHPSLPNHRTGRRCEKPGCDGHLGDSIIHFGENLPEKELGKAVEHAEKSDLAIVLGTSMRVSPASELPEMVAGGRLVIVNLQATPKDDKAALRIFAKTDAVMELLMAKLGLDIPAYQETEEGEADPTTTAAAVADQDSGAAAAAE